MGSNADTHAPVAARLGYNGQLHEPLGGWQALGNGHRIYNPVLMRFHSPDALSPFDKGGINAYAYCGSEPINQVDPSGRFHWKMMAVGVVFTGIGLTVTSARGLLSSKEDAEKVLSVVGIIAGLAISGIASFYVGRKGQPKTAAASNQSTADSPTAPPLTPAPPSAAQASFFGVEPNMAVPLTTTPARRASVPAMAPPGWTPPSRAELRLSGQRRDSLTSQRSQSASSASPAVDEARRSSTLADLPRTSGEVRKGRGERKKLELPRRNSIYAYYLA